jgi:hypothetical protein
MEAVVTTDTSNDQQAAAPVVLFIDANQYLSLYGLATGKKLLDLLRGQRNRVFVPAQIVDEVNRNKLKKASQFFAEQTEKMKFAALPDHLLGLPAKKLSQLRQKFQDAESAKQEYLAVAGDLLEKISRSEDDVSTVLRSLFENAVSPTSAQIERARERRERGNPPGKANDPLGDQICWEQLLDYCRDHSCREIWIVTGDTDYHTSFGGKLLLNPLLNTNLTTACGRQLDIRCFNNLLIGLAEFGKKLGVSKDKLPTPVEAKKIKEEFDDWNANTQDQAMGVILNYNLKQLGPIPTANAPWLWAIPPKATSTSN